MKINFITDPGHGWLEVPIAEVFRTGIYKKISPYSYVSDTHLYLEEDCDMGLYVKALERTSEIIHLNELFVNCFPRDYKTGIKRIDDCVIAS